MCVQQGKNQKTVRNRITGNMKTGSNIILLLACLIVFGCANFKQVNDFTFTSLQRTEENENLPVNFH